MGIHQCLLNLVTNAIDACVDTEPLGGEQRITLSVSESRDGGICYRVADTCLCRNFLKLIIDNQYYTRLLKSGNYSM